MSKESLSHNYDYISVCSSRPKYQGHRLSLILRQQPVQARFSTSNERDRKPIEPPPIIQIQLKNGTTQEAQDFLQNPYFFMCVNLISATSNEDISRPDNRVLSGQTVSSMYKLKDVTDNDGGFFCFGDLSSRVEGEYRLKFTLFEIIAIGAVNLMHTFSNVFKVYNSKNMPKLLDATFLSRSFSDQGVRIRIRKEHRVQVTNARKRKLSTDDSATSPSQCYGTPATLLPTKRLSTAGPTSPTFDSYFTAYDLQKQQHVSSRYNQQSEACAPPSLERNPSYQQPFNSYMHSIPFSPPPQPYDIHLRSNSIPYHSQNSSFQHHLQPLQQQHEQSKCRHHSLHPYYQQYPSPTAMLSPPSAQLQLEHRWHNVDDDKMTFPPSPRASIMSTTSSVSIPPPPDYHRSSEGSIDSTSTTEWGYYQTQQAKGIIRPSPPPSTHAIRLPPLHTLISRNEATFGLSHDNRKSDVGEVNAAVAMMQLSRRPSNSTVNLETDQYPQHNHLHHQQCGLLDLSRHASTGILNGNSY